MHLSYRERDHGTSGEASDRRSHENEVADRRALTMLLDFRRTTTSEKRKSDSVLDQLGGQSRQPPGCPFESVRGSRVGQALGANSDACFFVSLVMGRASCAILWMMSKGGLKSGTTSGSGRTLERCAPVPGAGFPARCTSGQPSHVAQLRCGSASAPGSRQCSGVTCDHLGPGKSGVVANRDQIVARPPPGCCGEGNKSGPAAQRMGKSWKECGWERGTEILDESPSLFASSRMARISFR